MMSQHRNQDGIPTNSTTAEGKISYGNLDLFNSKVANSP